MFSFPYALLAVVIAQSLTALAKNSPTPDDLKAARDEMEVFKTPVAFRPKESDIIYVKDTALDVWIIDLDDSFLLGKGAQGVVRRAWKATVGVPPAEAPQYVVKWLLDVDDSEKIGEQPYTAEVDVLKALNRAPSHVLVSKIGTPVTKGTVQSEYKSCKSIHSVKLWGSRCNSAAEAFIFQLLIPGKQARKLKIYFNPEAIANVMEGMRRELNKLHRLGWVHADAHPGNFLASETDTPNQYSVTIIDFGKAHEITDMNRDTNAKGDFLLVDDFMIKMKTVQFDAPWGKYHPEGKLFEKRGNYFEKRFGHVEDWRIKFDRLRELQIVTFDVPGHYEEGKKFFESLPYYKSLFKQTMSQDPALVPDSRAARLLEDFKLFKNSFITAAVKLNYDARASANKGVEDLSLKIKRLEDIVADEVVAKREEAEEAKREEARTRELNEFIRGCQISRFYE